MAVEFSEVRGVLQPLCESIDGKSSVQRDNRDEWNGKVREYLDERNEINRQVKGLINEVQTQKAIRDELNLRVRGLKEVRAERSDHLKDIRTKLRAKLTAQEEEQGAQERRGDKRPSAGKIRADMERLEKRYNTGQFLGKKERDYRRNDARAQGLGQGC